MNGMILVFPHDLRPPACGNTIQMSKATSGQRTVRFAEKCELAVFRRATDEELGLV